jgi:hypothetical protein
MNDAVDLEMTLANENSEICVEMLTRTVRMDEHHELKLISTAMSDKKTRKREVFNLDAQPTLSQKVSTKPRPFVFFHTQVFQSFLWSVVFTLQLT